ncbi:hypothetical protein ACFWM7_34100 [Streptomyces sp. NPDC058375]
MVGRAEVRVKADQRFHSDRWQEKADGLGYTPEQAAALVRAF